MHRAHNYDILGDWHPLDWVIGALIGLSMLVGVLTYMCFFDVSVL